MDYEKAYKDSLEKARFLHQQAVAGGNPLMANRYEQIFPELAESEDERIRKGLLKIFKQSQNGYWAGMEIKDIVAYLEKQKE